MCIGRNTENDKFEFDNLRLENSKEKVVLGLTIDSKLTFESCIKNICSKVGQKLGALLRITNYLNQSIDLLANYSTGFYMIATLTTNELIQVKKTYF